MLPNSEQITFLTGNAELVAALPDLPVHRTFAPETVAFLSAFSRALMADARSRQYDDIMSYAFWIRNASLQHIREVYYPQADGKLGRGVSFHIAPSNVPVNFAVSFTSALLAGNACVVRISDKYYEQVEIIVDALKSCFANGYADFEPYLLLVRYAHNEAITAYFSSICDVRIIWGGNRTIERIRKAPLPPRAIEMTFADRYSLAFLDAKAVLSGDIAALVDGFYVDTYYMDQNACSSPRLLVWQGNAADVKAAQEQFWQALGEKVAAEYPLQPVQSIDKLEQFCLAATKLDGLHLQSGGDMDAVRIQVDELSAELMDYKLGGGFFYEYITEQLDIAAIKPILTKPCQSIAVCGFDSDALAEAIMNAGVRGVDRIVPVGKTMDLTFKWDGYDMIETMSRYLYHPQYLTNGRG